MAPLPSVRVNTAWGAFTNVGVDYFGPIYVKRGRGVEKRYGCLFTCLQSRAVHLEVAYSLSADSFIMTLMRFVARRGKPDNIYSDNGTNFVAADKELKKYVQALDGDRVSNDLSRRGIQWHFNPPYSSHRGGEWERLIREVRRILNAICREQRFTDELLITILTEVERILNNRPLVPSVSEDHSELALTPNDLLLARGNSGMFQDLQLPDHFVRGWKQANHAVGSFWKRWSSDYVTSLQSRQKWITRGRNFKEGDIVIVVSSGLSRDQWPLGIVVGSEIGLDGLVRTVEVKTKSGILRRDVRHVCLLEGVG